MKNTIPLYLEEKFSLRHAVAKKFPQEIIQFMFEYYDYYNWEFDKTVENIFVVMRAGIAELKKCKFDKCNKQQSIQINGRKTRVLDCCCVSHATQYNMFKKYGVTNISHLKETSEKRKQKCLEKYGTESFFQTETFKMKTKKTCLEKYGVSHPMKNEKIKEKQQSSLFDNYGVNVPLKSNIIKDRVKKTNLERYGVEWTQSNTEIRNKSIKTNLERYGVKYTQSNPSIKQKSIETLKKKYGVTNPMQNESFKLKQQLSLFRHYGVFSPMLSEELKNKCISNMKKTVFEKYGVTNVMHVPEIAKKAQKHSRSNKIFTWKTGETIIVQGYENIVLAEMEKNGYTYSDIKTDKVDVPEIWYEISGKKHRYYPDIFIPTENLVIEVKSEYYMYNNLEINLKKAQATIDAGFYFKFEIR